MRDINICDWCGSHGCSPDCPGPPESEQEICECCGSPKFRCEATLDLVPDHFQGGAADLVRDMRRQ